MYPDQSSLVVAVAVLLIVVSTAPAATDGNQLDGGAADRSALLQFKAAVVSDPGGLLSSWSGPEHWSWFGVFCDSRFRVISLNISGRGDFFAAPCPKSGPLRRSCSDPGRRLTGGLSPALGRLSELRMLSLPFHGFSGEFPGGIWGLKNLVVLDLEESSLSGTLPSQFPPSLQVLNLRSNLIRGQIPPSLLSCINLEILDLFGNQLNGSIPGFLGNFSNLRSLYLSFNRLGGSIPKEIGSSCQNLEHLDLSGNILVGAIPRSLRNCRQLQSLLVFSNLLDDSIPSDLGWLQKLRVLDVSRNSLSGPVPPELGNCRELSVLVLVDLYDVNPGGDVYSEEFNYFQGGLPENITSLPNLRILWAPKAIFEGPIPRNWGDCQSLEIVNLGQNIFTGQLPTAFSSCENLRFLNLSSNKLTGWLREDLRVPSMDVFDVSDNQLSGSIPIFIACSECHSFAFSPDDLSASYSSFFVDRARVRVLLPSLGTGNEHTIYHNFGGNNFSGLLPVLPVASERFGNQTVYVIVAAGNRLLGSLNGILFDKCNDLNVLIANFSSNMISGGIPAEISSFCRSLLVLDAANNQVTGTLPESLGFLRNLVVLDLSGNRLQGQIPESFGELKALNYLSLATNNLSGPIPAGLDQLHSLKVLDLSFNSLSGEISGSLVNLKNLTVLLLDHNRLSGKFPSGFASLNSLSVFNASFNNLSGPLPFDVSILTCEAVIGNPLIQPCYESSLSIPRDLQGRIGDYQSYPSPPPMSSPTGNSGSGFSSIEIASITSAAAIVSVLLALVILYLYTKKCVPRSLVWSSETRDVTIFTEIGVPVTYESIVRATGNFSGSNCIGSGGFGATYKAEISPGVLVAIKRLSVGRFQGLQQFHAEIKTLGRWRHPNLVTLIGYHVSDSEMFLIYNYLPGGNLERFIHERSKRAVDWRMLHKIALDVARALAYLHDQCVPRILHRDVKPSNILLDTDFNAYLSDFGLARLLGNSETHATTGVAGTFGYVAPEYAMTCRVSDKADVYSYGVVLLELISDKKALDPSFSPYGNGFNIVAWACMLLQQGRAHEFFIEGLWDVGPHDDLVEALHLGVMCTVDSLSIRPTMKQVVQRLKQLQPPT